jgi:3-oxoacyl-[acyl-carrier protein] reductase
MGRLDGRKAVITGASSGIGAGVARAFAAEGADVAVNFPTEKEAAAAEAVCQELRNAGRDALAVRADVSDEAEVAALAEVALAHFGRVDILVGNAGIATSAPVHEMSAAMWDRMLAIHLRGVFLCARAFLPAMKKHGYGRIIHTASQLAYKGAAGFAHYTAAKAGIIGFTRSLALELGEADITANCVAPGATQTPILAGVPDEILETIRASIPKGRLAEVDDIVPAYVFLASDEARYMMGQCVSPNGGDVFL